MNRKRAFLISIFVAIVLISNCSATQQPPEPKPATQVPTKAATKTGKWGYTATPADPNATPQAKALLNYLTNLPNLSSNKVLSGQQNCAASGENESNGVYSNTKKYPAILGRDIYLEYIQDVTTSVSDIIAYANAGGIVQMGFTPGNPVNPVRENPYIADPWDTTPVNMVDLITNGTTANTHFKAMLDIIVELGHQRLQAAAVPVLFRPMQEMNSGYGTWFWWQGKDPTQYKNVWKYMFNYLTTTKGLHNMIWVYAPNGDLSADYYPGSDYVDIVGVDYYPSSNTTTIPPIRGYSNAALWGKPFAITEYGPCRGDAKSCPAQDMRPLIASIKENIPNTIYWLQWCRYWGMDQMLYVTELLNDSWVITRDEVFRPQKKDRQKK